MPGDATHHARSPQIPRWFHKKCGIVSQGFLNAGSGNWFPAHVANHGYHAALRGESIKGTFDHGAHFNFLPPSMTLVSEYHSFSASLTFLPRAATKHMPFIISSPNVFSF